MAGGWEDEEWRGAIDDDYDDGRPSRADLAAEQAEDDFWEEKERDYPRGYGPPQTGDEDHDYPGWLYVDDEAPEDDEVTDLDLDEVDDFDPYEDEIGDGPLPFDTPIYHPGGGYDDYDKTLSVIEEQEGSGPDIEKFSSERKPPLAPGTAVYRNNTARSPEYGERQSGAPQEIASVVGHTDDLGGDYDFHRSQYGPGYIYKLRRPGTTGKGGQVEWHEKKLTVGSRKFSATEEFDCDGIHNWGPNERCEDCGKEDTREPGDEKPIKIRPKSGRTNPFDQREGMARRIGPGSYEHDSPYGTFGINRVVSPGYEGGASWHLSPPSWDGRPGNPTDVYWTKAEALQAINEMLANPDLYELQVPDPENLEYAKSLDSGEMRHHRVSRQRLAWGDNKQPYKKPPKEPEVAIRNDDVKIMRDSETGLGYDAIVRVNDKGGYDVIKILGAQRNPFRAEVLNAEEEGLDFGGKRWGAGCPEHGNVIGCRSKADAQRMETWEFCDDCREKI
jgi:hypothetical protein